MAPSAIPDSPSPPTVSDNEENNLQQFFVLHKALPRKSSRKVSGPGKTRRKIDLSPASPKSEGKSGANHVEEEDDCYYEQLRVEAFNAVWSEIETKIKDVLREINISAFDEVHRWVCECFSTIKSSGTPEAVRPYPLVTDINCKQIFTALVLTKNIEFVDDLLTFEELGLHLKSKGCHVANLSSLDFSAKNGIGGCLRSLLRQLVMVSLDAPDIAVLASWYSEQENYNNPSVVIIGDMERCSGSVLAEFILMLREWVVKIPIILVMGVATTIDAPRNLLPSNALKHLCPFKFSLGSPYERMDAIVEAVLLKTCFGFNVGHKVVFFLRNYFQRQDGTVTSFIKAFKIACAKHFSTEPLSFLCRDLLNDDSEGFWSEKCALLPEVMLKNAFSFPSCQRCKMTEGTSENLASGLFELKKLQKNWSSVVLCLHEVGKFQKMHLLDIVCEALDPATYNKNASDNHLGIGNGFSKSSPSDCCLHAGQYSGKSKGGIISQVVRRVRDLPVALLSQLLNIWRKHTKGISEIHDKVKELQSMLKFEDNGKSLKQDSKDTPKRPSSRGTMNMEDKKTVNEKSATLMEYMIVNYLQPIECIPFHEIICFKNVELLQSPFHSMGIFLDPLSVSSRTM
ncbi:PREDICTED: origin of replication complex subunit 3 isoform X2 [Nelumbo nucifera]|uniref:Origin of replication complex subunit 3 isoform X2 n=1 Tax=Nelumbo nucifera TaxID=4432 RepID=A0A1U7YX01_NELNU|nr:PREDICTED: origin of replication complex subunit 3 isoform X2 [Nelumbo nucifera]